MTNFLLSQVPRNPRFTSAQFQTLVDICIGIGLVALASVVLPAAIDRGDTSVLLLGIATTLVFWSLAMWLAKKIR
ncbi:MAG: hypothetical protein HY381_00315 [Candidatus Chisholmbacteria bacterium]|nr:hypothetical protein [Candidatus Chisholmbacteria bacterium]